MAKPKLLTQAEKTELAIAKYELLYKARLTKKKFIPIELIAKDPIKYGYPHLQPRESNARQGDAINDKNKMKLIIGGNRASKSVTGWIDLAKDLSTCKIHRPRVWVVTETYDLAREGIQSVMLDYLKPEDIKKVSHIKGGTIGDIQLGNRYNNALIGFKSYAQGESRLQAAKLYKVLFDEEPPERVFEECYARTLDLRGSLTLCFTPVRGITWSKDRLYNSTRKDISIFKWSMYDNPFIPLEEIDAMKNDLTPRMAKIRIYGEYAGSDRTVFSCFDRDKHCKPRLYNADLPVDVTIDWGVNTACIIFGQAVNVVEKNIANKNYNIINAVEVYDTGYGKIIETMRSIASKNYYNLGRYFCDPAGAARSQSSRSGYSLLRQIEDDYNIRFNYAINLKIEESAELVNSLFENAKGVHRLFIDSDIRLNSKGDLPATRLENYVRDDKTNQPVKDGINDHFCDTLRYWIANDMKSQGYKFGVF